MNSTQIVKSSWDCLYLVGADLASKLTDAAWKNLRSKTGCLVVQDLFMTKSAEAADVVLPSLCFVEKGGSFFNIEQRVQKLKPGKSIPKGVYADSYIFVRLAQRLGRALVIDEAFIECLKPGILKQERHILPVEKREQMPNESGLVASFAHALFD